MTGNALCRGLAPRSAFANLHATLLVLNHPPQGRITLDQAGRRSNGLPRFRRNLPDHSVRMPQGHPSLTSPGLIAAIHSSRRSSLRQDPTMPPFPAARTVPDSILPGALPAIPAFTGLAAKAYRHWITRLQIGYYPLPIPVAAATGFRQLCRILPDCKSRIPEDIRFLLRLTGSFRPAALAANRFALVRPRLAFSPVKVFLHGDLSGGLQSPPAFAGFSASLSFRRFQPPQGRPTPAVGQDSAATGFHQSCHNLSWLTHPKAFWA